VTVPTRLKPERATRRIKRSLNKPFAMEVIILMCWSTWSERNGWIFSNKDPRVVDCIATFKRELALVIHRTKKSWVPELESWLCSLNF
jgi:hypothetical protein